MTTSTNVTSQSAIGEAAFNDLIEQLTQRMQAGESIDIEAVIAAHGEYADEIRRLVPALQALAELPNAGSSAPPNPNLNDASAISNRAIGDFLILREIGRGGMGIVYEAKQLSLNRKVALKVLPFAATMDTRHLQRFHHEAQAAAMLHHPHIVPVFGVGSDRGIHYYAMQLIGGQSLAQFVAGLRGEKIDPGQHATIAYGSATAHTPAAAIVSTLPERKEKTHFRQIAAWIADAADALEYAHSMGVVHRDVKPGNLLLDDGGNMWVTDFGLAKLESGAGMTMTGDIVGTLRYMSPEQALAKHGLVDHRTDVYSLGATLYELLTLRSPVDGVDKQEVLHKIAFADPIPLRRFDGSIPLELETVTLKCLAKEPRERYESAAALADDLRRFMDDRPVVAQRTTKAEKAMRWAKRNPLVVTLLSALFFSLIGGLAATYAQWRRAEKEAEAALVQKGIAERASDLSWRAVRGTIQGLNSSTARHTVTDLRAQVFTQMMKLSDELAADPSPQRKFDRALIAMGLGLARVEIGQTASGLNDLQHGLNLVEELVREQPDNLEFRDQLVYGLRSYANALQWTEPIRAELLTRQAVAEARNLVNAEPTPVRRLNLAGCLRLHVKTLEKLKKSNQEPRRESNDICRQLIVENPTGIAVEVPLELAANYRDDSRHALSSGAVESAIELAQSAVDLVDSYLPRFPRRTDVLMSVAQSCGSLASGHYSNKNWPAALEQYRRAVGLARELLQIDPTNATFQNCLDIQLCTMAMGLAQLQKYDDALLALDEATAAQQSLVGIHKDRAPYRETLYHLLRNRCRVHGMAGAYQASAEAAQVLAKLEYSQGVEAADAAYYALQAMIAAKEDATLSADDQRRAAARYRQQALDHLKSADGRGYTDNKRLRSKFFEPLHHDPEFETILQRIAARSSAQDDVPRDD